MRWRYSCLWYNSKLASTDSSTQLLAMAQALYSSQTWSLSFFSFLDFSQSMRLCHFGVRQVSMDVNDSCHEAKCLRDPSNSGGAFMSRPSIGFSSNSLGALYSGLVSAVCRRSKSARSWCTMHSSSLMRTCSAVIRGLISGWRVGAAVGAATGSMPGGSDPGTGISVPTVAGGVIIVKFRVRGVTGTSTVTGGVSTVDPVAMLRTTKFRY